MTGETVRAPAGREQPAAALRLLLRVLAAADAHTGRWRTACPRCQAPRLLTLEVDHVTRDTVHIRCSACRDERLVRLAAEPIRGATR